MISNSLDIDIFHGDIHGCSCKKSKNVFRPEYHGRRIVRGIFTCILEMKFLWVQLAINQYCTGNTLVQKADKTARGPIMTQLTEAFMRHPDNKFFIDTKFSSCIFPRVICNLNFKCRY